MSLIKQGQICPKDAGLVKPGTIETPSNAAADDLSIPAELAEWCARVEAETNEALAPLEAECAEFDALLAEWAAQSERELGEMLEALRAGGAS